MKTSQGDLQDKRNWKCVASYEETLCIVSIKNPCRTLVIDPHYDAALNNKGAALDNLGNYTGAIEYFDRALAIDPQYVGALDNEGLGNYTGDIEYFDKALAIDPKHIAALA